jgi:hypothetical protein
MNQEQWFGPEGQTQIVFTSAGNVMLLVKGEKAEHKALRKNSYSKVVAGGVTLSIGDFSCQHKGVPSYAESLATLVDWVVHTCHDDEDASGTIDQLRSVIIAARRRVHEEVGKNDHARGRAIVCHLAKELGRPPTRSEIRECSGWSSAKIALFCNANGLSWMLRGDSGRPPKN